MPLRGPTFHCTPPRLRRVNVTGTHPVGLHRGVVVLRLQWTRLRLVNLTGIPSGFAEAKPGLRFGSSWLRLVNLTGVPVGLYIGCFVLRLCNSRLRLVKLTESWAPHRMSLAAKSPTSMHSSWLRLVNQREDSSATAACSPAPLLTCICFFLPPFFRRQKIFSGTLFPSELNPTRILQRLLRYVYLSGEPLRLRKRTLRDVNLSWVRLDPT